MSTVAARPGEAVATRYADRYATTDMCVVTAAEISDFRGLLRSAIEARTAEGTPKASPVHSFLLSSTTYEQLVGQLTPVDGPRPTTVHLGQQLWLRGGFPPSALDRAFVVAPVARRYPLSAGVDVLPVRELGAALAAALVAGPGAHR